MLKGINDFMLFCSYKTMVKMIIFLKLFSHWPGLITLKHNSYRKVRFNASFSPLIANCQSEALYDDDVQWGPRRVCVCVTFWFLLLLLWPFLFVSVPLWTHKLFNVVSVAADVINAHLFTSPQHSPFLNRKIANTCNSSPEDFYLIFWIGQAGSARKWTHWEPLSGL